MQEIWKDVIDTNYEVSNKGNIRNKKSGKILKGGLDKKGYRNVSIKYRKTYRVHRLVAEAFIENPFSKEQVNHIDGNKINNSVENLEWVNNKENILHSYSILKRKTTKGYKYPNRKRKNSAPQLT